MEKYGQARRDVYKRSYLHKSGTLRHTSSRGRDLVCSKSHASLCYPVSPLLFAKAGGVFAAARGAVASAAGGKTVASAE
jgi:hypothetical protein